MGEGLPRSSPKAARSLFHIRAHVFKHRLHRANDKGDAGEKHRNHDAERRIGNLDAKRLQHAPEPAVMRKERHKGKAGNCRRQGEGKINGRIDEALAGKVVARQHPGQQQAEQTIEDRGDSGGAHGDAIGRQRPLGGDNIPEIAPPQAGCLQDHRQQGKRNDDREINQSAAEGQSESRQHRIAFHT
ncbi:hypothetical protein DK52_758 [Brucella abortus]|nr:hypothetical protein DK52_758 [Brucella abortus]